MEFTLLDEESIDPLVEARLETPTSAGIRRVRLSDFGVRLAAGREYEWSIAIVVDPDERSKDIVSTGWINRVERADGLGGRLAAAGATGSAYVFAEEGLWYDAMAAVGDLIEENPLDPDLAELRIALLRQIGLGGVVEAPAR